MKRRNYLLNENEIYKKAPVKRFSVCTWIAEWFFGLWSVCCYERLFFFEGGEIRGCLMIKNGMGEGGQSSSS